MARSGIGGSAVWRVFPSGGSLQPFPHVLFTSFGMESVRPRSVAVSLSFVHLAHAQY